MRMNQPRNNTFAPWGHILRTVAFICLLVASAGVAARADIKVLPGSSPVGYVPLSSIDINPQTGVGDSYYAEYALPFLLAYNGQNWSKIGVSADGYVVLTNSTASAAGTANTTLPNATDPDNILAPFWTDLNPAVAGELRIGLLTTLPDDPDVLDDSDMWVVVEWTGVADAFDTSVRNTFQVWIGAAGDANPGEDISFVYSTVGSGSNNLLTVGAEDAAGAVGDTYFYNGSGTVPTSGTELRVTSAPHTNEAPVLDVANDSVTVNTELKFTALASDAENDWLTFSLADGTDPVPAGAVINPTSGVFTWTPTTTGTYSFKFVVTDNGTPNLSDEQEITITVNPPNAAPVATDTTVSTSEDTELEIDLAGIVSDDNTADADLVYFLGDEPPAEEGTVDLVDSKVTFTPAQNFAGETSFTYHVVDEGNLPSETKKVTINVTSENDAPVLDPIGDMNATEGVQLAFTAEADDAEDNLLTFSLVDAPVGAAITDDGDFTWTPSEAQGPGSFTFKVRVSDGDKADEEEITITVAEVNSAPVLPFIGARTLKYGGTTTFNFAATDADLPKNTLTYSLIGAPTGASINSSGVFSWTPTAAQSNNNFYSFKVKVVDDGTPALSDEETASFTVQRPNINTAPVLPFMGARTVFVGANATVNYAATDADIPKDALTYSLVGAPAGASINPSTGVFSWIPTAGQAVSPNNFYSFKVKVTDDGFPAKSDEETASFTVAFPVDISVNTTNPSLKANNASQNVTITYTVRNNSNVAYTNLQVKGDVFWPSTLQGVVLTPAAGTTGQVFALTATSKWVQWTIPSLPAGTSKTISVKLTGVVPTNAPAKSKIASGWTVSSVTTGVIPSMSSPEVFLNTYK